MLIILNLVVLNFTKVNNELSNLDSLMNIETILLKNKNITLLGDEISKYRDLVKIDISENHLNYLPSSLTDLPKLQKIYASNNKLEIFDLNLTNNRLTRLDLKSNYIVHIPSEIQKMDNLMFLRLSSNMIKYVPIEFVNLKNLKYLSLAHNKIKKIPENFNNLTKLKCFNIFDNNLQKVPDAIYKMNFKYLNIGNNNINELKSFQNTYIKELSLNQNMISLFPELNINIKILNLNNNKIAKLPDDLHKYIDLEYLDLSFNEIKYISKSFLNHKYKFKYLNLKGNFIQQKGNSKFLGQDDLRKYFQEIIVLDDCCNNFQLKNDYIHKEQYNFSKNRSEKENVENRNKFFKTNSSINLSEKKDLDEDFSINSEREIKNFQSLELNLNYIDINQNDCLTFNNINNQLEEKPITQNLKENYTNDTLKINEVKKLNFGKNKIDDVELANEIDYSLCIIDKDKILHPNENLKKFKSYELFDFDEEKKLKLENNDTIEHKSIFNESSKNCNLLKYFNKKIKENFENMETFDLYDFDKEKLEQIEKNDHEYIKPYMIDNFQPENNKLIFENISNIIGINISNTEKNEINNIKKIPILKNNNETSFQEKIIRDISKNKNLKKEHEDCNKSEITQQNTQSKSNSKNDILSLDVKNNDIQSYEFLRLDKQYEQKILNLWFETLFYKKYLDVYKQLETLFNSYDKKLQNILRKEINKNIKNVKDILKYNENDNMSEFYIVNYKNLIDDFKFYHEHVDIINKYLNHIYNPDVKYKFWKIKIEMKKELLLMLEEIFIKLNGIEFFMVINNVKKICTGIQKSPAAQYKIIKEVIKDLNLFYESSDL